MHTTKDDRRWDAKERQAARDERGDVKQLAMLLVNRFGRSKRETARLTARIGVSMRRSDFVLAAGGAA